MSTCCIVDAVSIKTRIDLPTSRAQFFPEREARAVDFLCFLRQKLPERELRSERL